VTIGAGTEKEGRSLKSEERSGTFFLSGCTRMMNTGEASFCALQGSGDLVYV
jgi:hypothetical protein